MTTPTPLLDPLVAGFVQDAGYHVSGPDGSAVLAVNQSQLRLVVHQAGSELTVEVFERGSSNGIELMTSDPVVLRTFVVLWVAGSWRYKHGLPELPLGDARAPEGYTVVEERRRVHGVQGSGGAWVAREMRLVDAERLALALPHPPDVVVAACKAEDGAPVWTSGRRRRLWR